MATCRYAAIPPSRRPTSCVRSLTSVELTRMTPSTVANDSAQPACSWKQLLVFQAGSLALHSERNFASSGPPLV